MSLIEILRGARARPISVLHEFKLLYDPSKLQVHAFVEGQADKVFYATFIRPRLSPDTRLHLYDCRGKKVVYEAQEKVKSDYPDARTLLFFVDKDLDDLIGAQSQLDWVFCTEVYSIENYFDDPGALQRWFEEAFLLRDVRFDFSPVIEFYREEVSRFHRELLPIMGWVLAHRKCGNHPVLAGIDMNRLFSIDDIGQVRRRIVPGGRVSYLDRVAQVNSTLAILVETRRCIRTLRMVEASRWLRGKFLLWFLLQFIRSTEHYVRKVAVESGGTLKCPLQPHEGNLVELLVPRIEEPNSLAVFLDTWLPYIRPR